MSFQRQRGRARRFARLLKVAAWVQALPQRLMPSPFRLMQLGSAYWQSRALYVAVRLDVAGALGDQRLSAATLAHRVGADPDALGRLMRMLVSMAVFAEPEPGMFANTATSAWLRPDHPGTLRSLVLMHNAPEIAEPWFAALEQGIRTGETPFRLVHGVDLFAHMDRAPAFDALFAAAMQSVDALVGDSFAEDFAWDAFDRVVDVGGAKGSKSVALLRRHGGLRALVVDRAVTIAGARDYWNGRLEPSLLERMEFQPGDVLGTLLAIQPGDVLFLCAVLHGFDDDTAIAALRNIAAIARPVGAPLAVMELVLPETGADLSCTAIDMQMFVNSRGRERTLADWRSLAERAGLSLREVVDLRSLAKILVLV